jgi:hypothetical protein
VFLTARRKVDEFDWLIDVDSGKFALIGDIVVVFDGHGRSIKKLGKLIEGLPG